MNSEENLIHEDDVLDEIELDIDDEDVIYQINSFGVDFLVDGLVSRMEKGDIYVPDFQRSFVWTHPQASRFIESILLGLPIPGIFSLSRGAISEASHYRWSPAIDDIEGLSEEPPSQQREDI